MPGMRKLSARPCLPSRTGRPLACSPCSSIQPKGNNTHIHTYRESLPAYLCMYVYTQRCQHVLIFLCAYFSLAAFMCVCVCVCLRACIYLWFFVFNHQSKNILFVWVCVCVCTFIKYYCSYFVDILGIFYCSETKLVLLWLLVCTQVLGHCVIVIVITIVVVVAAVVVRIYTYTYIGQRLLILMPKPWITVNQ